MTRIKSRRSRFKSILSIALALHIGWIGSARCGEPVAVIFDTDIGPDCDDVSALCVLHGLAQRDEAKILATICCTSSEWGAPCLDALNTFFGRPDIPVGTLKDAGFVAHSAFNRAIAQRYPHGVRNGQDAPDATSLYRRILAAQPDEGVVIIAVGPLRNLRKLVDSGPDGHSRLGGKELIAKKVRLLSCMGGWYPKVPDGWGAEWNFAQDAESTRRVLREWPTPIIFSGAEVGSGIMTGRRVAVDGPEYHPLTLAFALSPDVGLGADRASWDDTSVLVAVRGVGGVFELSKAGINSPGEAGANTFVEQKDRGHRYLIRSRPASEAERVLEDLMVGAKEGPLAFDFNIATYSADGIGTVSARDEELPDGRGGNAFDRDAKSVWAAQAPGSWVEYLCPDGRKYTLAGYRIASGPDAPEHDPNGWTLSASNDRGATWTSLDTRTGESFTHRLQSREFTCRNATACSLFRLQFGGSHAVRVGGIELLERISNAPGVKVSRVRLDRTELSVPVAGRASLNVDVLPVDATFKVVSWASSDPTVALVKPIGKNTAVISGRSVGSCIVKATARDGGTAATCRITVTPSTLPASWEYEEVNEPHVPGRASYHLGTFRVAGGGMAIERWWLRVWDQFSLVSQIRQGDSSIAARLISQSVSSRHAIAGLMFRETLARDSRFVMLGYSPSRELVLSWRDGPDDEGSRRVLGTFDLPVFLKLERRGATFDASASKDGVRWGKPLGRHASKSFEFLMKAGLCVCARNNLTTSEAVFDQVNLSHDRDSR